MTCDLSARFDPALPVATVALRSWQSIRTATMLWLWYLNLLYWIAFVYLPQAEAVWALIAYFAVAPLILLMIVRQRGLTRLSGLIHLPWVPFTIYLGLRLFSDALGPALSPEEQLAYYGWLQLMFWSTAICLVLDAVDLARWRDGERYVLGTPAAAARGASKLARQRM